MPRESVMGSSTKLVNTMASTSLTIPHRGRSYGLLLTANFLWFFAYGIYIYFIGLYVRGLGANPFEIGIYSGVFEASALICTAVGGPLTSRFGIKRVLVLSWASIAPAPLIYLWAPTWHWALLAGACEGTGWLASAAFRTYVTYVAGGERRGLAYSMMYSSSAIAGIPAPAVGGLLIASTGYGTLFLIAVALYVISTLALLPISSVAHSATDTKQRAGRTFLSNRVFGLATTVSAVVLSLYAVANIFIPLFLTDRFGLHESQIGVLASILSASSALLGPLLGMAGDRWGHSKILALPVSSYLGSLGLLVIVPTPIVLPVVYAFQGLSSGLFVLTNSIVSHHVAQDQLPNAFAVLASLSRVLTPFTPFLGGLGYTINATLPLLAAVAFLPLALLLVLLLVRSEVARSGQPSKS